MSGVLHATRRDFLRLSAVSAGGLVLGVRFSRAAAAEDLAGEYAVVRYGTPDDFVIDLTSRIGDAFRFGDVEWDTVVVAGVPARVATPRMLYRMKKDTVRPHDRADAAELKRKFGLEDE